MEVKMSVIVPVYNGERFLHKCLDAIVSSKCRDFELIVVDDCSTDSSAGIAAAKEARVLKTERQSGPGSARNLAAKTAKGEILMFVDADVVIKPETLGLVAAAFDREYEISALFGSYDDTPAEPNFLSQYKNLYHHYVHQTSNREASTFWAGLGAVKRDVFLDVGGFDCVKYAVPSIEDIELGARLKESGHIIRLDPSIQATHLKMWKPWSLIRTDVFCRAIPWTKLMVSGNGVVNDLNLKVSDRLSAVSVGLMAICLPLALWKPMFLILFALLIMFMIVLNRRIIAFFAEKRGIIFALLTVPWQALYYFYSGTVFVICWAQHYLFRILRPNAASGLNRGTN